MNKHLIIALTVGLSLGTGWTVEKPNPREFEPPKMTLDLDAMSKYTREQVDALSPDIRREYFKQMSYKRFGGIIEKPGTGKGLFLVYDSTGKATEGMFARDFHMIERTIKIRPKFAKGEPVTVENASDAKKKANANAAVFLVESKVLPRLLTAPEEGWAIVNVSQLVSEGMATNVFAKRLTVETVRAIALVSGCGNTGLSMSAITSVTDIDALAHTGFPATAAKVCAGQLKKFGFEPGVTANYRTACKQGWAPKPENEIQKKIWDEVHEIPSKPIKIEYNEKRDKGK